MQISKDDRVRPAIRTQRCMWTLSTFIVKAWKCNKCMQTSKSHMHTCTHAWVGLFTPLCNKSLSYLCLSSPHIFTCPLRRETAVQHTLCPTASLFSYSIMVLGHWISFLSLAASFKKIMFLSSKSNKIKRQARSYEIASLSWQDKLHTVTLMVTCMACKSLFH